MGETQQRPFQLSFNSALWVEFQGARAIRAKLGFDVTGPAMLRSGP